MVVRNPELIPGIEKYGRVRAYHKAGRWAVKNKYNVKKVVKAPTPKVKPMKGTKNGATREIRKKVRAYSTYDASVPLKNHKTQHAPKLRASLVPGAVVILLAGKFAGKRVVFLKQLASGLLLVTGPYKINGVPLRRVSAAYVIATQTRVEINAAAAENVTDAFFAKEKVAAAKKSEGEFFASGSQTKAPKKKISAERAAAQKAVDAAVIKAVGKRTDLAKYLKAHFTLTAGQYPHELVF